VGLHHLSTICSIKLVSHFDCSAIPVCPVNIILKHADCKRVSGKGQFPHQHSVAAIKVTRLNSLQFSIDPVQSLCGKVNGETIRPVDVCIDNSSSVLALKGCLLYLSISTPVCPEYVPVDYNGDRMCEL